MGPGCAGRYERHPDIGLLRISSSKKITLIAIEMSSLFVDFKI